jgi:retron-type reverse transcriptase
MQTIKHIIARVSWEIWSERNNKKYGTNYKGIRGIISRSVANLDLNMKASLLLLKHNTKPLF